MPELPEVEVVRQYMESAMLNEQIVDVIVLDSKIVKMGEDVFINALTSYSLLEVLRSGKYLFIRLSSGKWWVIHFGLTGRLHYSHRKADLPKYTRVVVNFVSGYQMAITSLRKFGKTLIVDDPSLYKKDIKLGVDAMDIKFESFVQNIRKSAMPIKSRLLMQSCVAGIGNWIADEMLYQAKIHPSSISNQLGDIQLELLYEVMQEIMQTAIRLQSNFDIFPDGYLVKNRKKGEICFHTGKEIEKSEINGRGTYYSPHWQKVYK